MGKNLKGKHEVVGSVWYRIGKVSRWTDAENPEVSSWQSREVSRSEDRSIKET